jgi:DNA-binding NarL/FixJ family response regulator
VLEAGWAQRLEWRARRTGPVIALAGFADRAVVARARGAGAVACLELPCDLDDLVDAVDRTVTLATPESWPIPARVEPPHELPPRRKASRHRSLVAPPTWPDGGPLPRIPSQ